MATRLSLIMVLVILVSTALVGVAIGAARTSGATATCEQTVRHDTFRNQEAIDAFNETGQATSRLQNTRVKLEDAPGFIRLRSKNPNGYCVRYVVEVSPEIVSAADLGTIESNSGEVEASWTAAQNLSSGEVRTRVEFTLPAGANATFAPSTVRVQSLSWTGTAKREGSGVVSRAKDLWGSSKLEQREYEIEPTRSSSRITVPLEKDGERIEDWYATYQLNGSSRSVTQDASEPVYYSESSDAVTFHFSDRAVRAGASVSFTAEPTPVESFSHSAESYWSGLTEGTSWIESLPFATNGGIAS